MITTTFLPITLLNEGFRCTVVFSGYSIKHYVIKFVSDLRQVGGFLGVLYKTLCDKVCH
jgi:hypothetical protein